VDGGWWVPKISVNARVMERSTNKEGLRLCGWWVAKIVVNPRVYGVKYKQRGLDVMESVKPNIVLGDCNHILGLKSLK